MTERWRASLLRCEKFDESEVNGCVFDLFRVKLPLISCKCEVYNNFFGDCKNYFQKLE